MGVSDRVFSALARLHCAEPEIPRGGLSLQVCRYETLFLSLLHPHVVVTVVSGSGPKVMDRLHTATMAGNTADGGCQDLFLSPCLAEARACPSTGVGIEPLF